jgi:hypothetical protein
MSKIARININITATSAAEIAYITASLATVDFSSSLDSEVQISDSNGNDAGSWLATSHATALRQKLAPRWWSMVDGLTDKQQQSACRVITRQGWLYDFSVCDGTLMLRFANILIGIEPNGYAHS